MATAVFVQEKNYKYGIEKGSTIWINEIDNSSVNDGEFIYFKSSQYGGAFGMIEDDTVESEDDIYLLSDCRTYRLEDEEISRVAKELSYGR